MLSDTAVAALAFLRSIPESVTCEECLAAYIGVDRHEALRSIRELVHTLDVLCNYAPCTICRERRLVAHVRRPRTGT